MAPTYASVMQNEEYLTPEEYLQRRENGLIDPGSVRYAACDPKTGKPGGFWVRLEKPRYVPRLEGSASLGLCHE